MGQLLYQPPKKKNLPTISFDKLLLLRFLKFGEFVTKTTDFVGTHMFSYGKSQGK